MTIAQCAFGYRAGLAATGEMRHSVHYMDKYESEVAVLPNSFQIRLIYPEDACEDRSGAAASPRSRKFPTPEEGWPVQLADSNS